MSLAEGAASRWFAPALPAAEPGAVHQLTQTLRETDHESYALLCEALGSFDLTGRLDEISIPVLAAAGEHDAVAPAEQAAAIGAGVHRSTVHVLSDAAHQAPTERPADTVKLLNDFLA